MEAALALHAERRFGLGRQTTEANRLLAFAAKAVLVALERGQRALALTEPKLRLFTRRFRHG